MPSFCTICDNIFSVFQNFSEKLVLLNNRLTFSAVCGFQDFLQICLFYTKFTIVSVFPTIYLWNFSKYDSKFFEIFVKHCNISLKLFFKFYYNLTEI